MLKISVVMPSFNQGNYIGAALESILDQRYPALELFVIDGGSTDDTVEVIRKYESNITAWVTEKDRGQSHAINKGFDRCSGDIVAWLCSDDLYEPGAFDKVARLFGSLPEQTGLVHGDAMIFDAKGDIVRDKGYAAVTPERILSGMAFPQPSAFFRKSVLDRAGRLDESLHYGMDYDLFARMSALCRFAYLPEVLSRYRLHDSSKTMTASHGFINDWLTVFNSIAVGMELDQASDLLHRIAPGCTTLAPLVDFFMEHKYPETVNQRILCYSLLSNVLRFDYNGGAFERARKTGKLLLSSYPDLLQEELPVHTIAKRAQWPGVLIRIMRKLNSIRSGR